MWKDLVNPVHKSISQLDSHIKEQNSILLANGGKNQVFCPVWCVDNKISFFLQLKLATSWGSKSQLVDRRMLNLEHGTSTQGLFPIFVQTSRRPSASLKLETSPVIRKHILIWQRHTCYRFPEIYLRCNTCQPLGRHHGSRAVLSEILWIHQYNW